MDEEHGHGAVFFKHSPSLPELYKHSLSSLSQSHSLPELDGQMVKRSKIEKTTIETL